MKNKTKIPWMTQTIIEIIILAWLVTFWEVDSQVIGFWKFFGGWIGASAIMKFSIIFMMDDE